VLNENEASGSPEWNQKHWWVQAEAVVGFTNAYQVSGERRFFDAAMKCWEVIQTQFVDKEHGDWFKVLDANGVPVEGQYKVGPWECPYHHARMCMEMTARLA
jgi:mannobiose 2-epimerase